MIYGFGDHQLDTDRFELRGPDGLVRVEPQVFEVLAHLVSHRHRMVPKEELLDSIWGDRFVSESALASRIRSARAAVGDDGRSQAVIRTVFGRGYQFVASVHEQVASSPENEPVPAAAARQSIRFCTTPDGFQLATAEVGDGRPMVKAGNWLTHVEQDWRSPVWRHWWAALGDRFRLVRYDIRGCGLSDRDLRGSNMSDVGLWVADLETVVDAYGLDRFVLLGQSQGGGVACAYAARHPDRVSHLVLYGAYARGMRRRGQELSREAELYIDLMKVGWGRPNPAFRQVFTSTFIPEGTSEAIRWFNDLQQTTTSVENALQIETAFYDEDFTEVATRVRAPTLVLHAAGDLSVPFEEGRRLAAAIRGAELVSLPSANHILLADEPAWPQFLTTVERFVAE